VEIYHEAVQKGSYTCFLKPDTRMPMMYMPDCLDATTQLLCADPKKLEKSVSRVYNVTAVSFTPAEQAESIRKCLPDFKINYAPDFRQAIADSWPASLEDSRARADWDWSPKYDLDAITRDMLSTLAPRYKKLFSLPPEAANSESLLDRAKRAVGKKPNNS